MVPVWEAFSRVSARAMMSFESRLTGSFSVLARLFERKLLLLILTATLAATAAPSLGQTNIPESPPALAQTNLPEPLPPVAQSNLPEPLPAMGETNIPARVPAVTDSPALTEAPRVDKTWLREALQPILATLAIFMMLVLGGRLMQTTSGKGEGILLAEGNQGRARFRNVVRNIGSDFWVAAAIVGLLAALRFHALLFLSLLVLYAGIKIAYVLLREQALFRERADEEQARTEAEQEQHSEIDDFAELLKRGPAGKPLKKKAPVPLRVEVRTRPTLQSEKFLSAGIHDNCFFSALSAARRAPLAAELIRKLHIRWKEFEVSDDSVYLNRQDESGALDHVCIVALHNNQEQKRGMRINAGFLQWALGNMLNKNDLVYETEDGYHAPDETERTQLALLPESRRPKLLPVKEIVNPWHAMIGNRQPGEQPRCRR